MTGSELVGLIRRGYTFDQLTCLLDDLAAEGVDIAALKMDAAGVAGLTQGEAELIRSL